MKQSMEGNQNITLTVFSQAEYEALQSKLQSAEKEIEELKKSATFVEIKKFKESYQKRIGELENEVEVLRRLSGRKPNTKLLIICLIVFIILLINGILYYKNSTNG